MPKQFYVYIVTNGSNKILYTGVTSSLINRIYQHRNHIIKNSFTYKYNLIKLVYFEQTTDFYIAISREKQIKAGSRQKKIDLIEKLNPSWNDLWEEITA